MNSATGLDVLVVEDDEDTCENLRDILELDSHRVSTAGSALEALNQRDWAALDVVILDRRLPDATAEGLLPKLKGFAPEADVIVVTGHGDVEGAIQALRAGAADYILKPINPDFLRVSIARTAEKRRLRQAREQSDAAFRLLVDTAECLVVILREDFQLVFLNPFAEDICGPLTGTANIVSFDCLIPGPARSRFQSEMLAANRDHFRGLDLPILAADGRERWVLWNARRLPEYEGAPAVLMVGLDITERRKALQRALQSERLAAIGEMVTGLAHESRNALQRSQACLEMLTLEVEDRPEAVRLVQRIQKAQDHLHHLYEEVRGYAAPIALRKQVCNLLEVVQATWGHLEIFRKGKSVRLFTDLKTADAACPADRNALEQVFRNILENSIVACPPEGEIRALFEDADLEGQPALRVRVQDNGPGLSPEQAARIFEPFFTTKTEGTGLGMAIARRIIETHGGQLCVGSPRSGAELIVTLPRGPTLSGDSKGSP